MELQDRTWSVSLYDLQKEFSFPLSGPMVVSFWHVLGTLRTERLLKVSYPQDSVRLQCVYPKDS